MKPVKLFITLSFLLLMITGPLWGADEIKPAKITPSDKCPVCGMFVAKYADFVDQIVFKDGTHAFFDGVKDMMKYYFDLPKYNPAKPRQILPHILVTDYYSFKLRMGSRPFMSSAVMSTAPWGKSSCLLKKKPRPKNLRSTIRARQFCHLRILPPN